MTGAPLIFESYSEYQAVVRSLIATNTIQEATQICWDLRPSERYPTIAEMMQQGNGAARQREVYKRSGSLEDVVDFVVRETAKGTTAV